MCLERVVPEVFVTQDPSGLCRSVQCTDRACASLSHGTQGKRIKGGSADQECVAEDTAITGLLLMGIRRISRRREDKTAT